MRAAIAMVALFAAAPTLAAEDDGGVPDAATEASQAAALRAVTGQDVALGRHDGSEWRGKLLRVDDGTAVLQLADGRVVTLPVEDVTAVKVAAKTATKGRERSTTKTRAARERRYRAAKRRQAERRALLREADSLSDTSRMLLIGGIAGCLAAGGLCGVWAFVWASPLVLVGTGVATVAGGAALAGSFAVDQTAKEKRSEAEAVPF